MIVFDHGSVDISHKTTEQIVDMRFKEYEIRQKKEAEDRAELARKLEANKAEVTQPAKEEPKAKVELATVPHPTAIGRAIAKIRNKLHI